MNLKNIQNRLSNYLISSQPSHLIKVTQKIQIALQLIPPSSQDCHLFNISETSINQNHPQVTCFPLVALPCHSIQETLQIAKIILQCMQSSITSQIIIYSQAPYGRTRLLVNLLLYLISNEKTFKIPGEIFFNTQQNYYKYYKHLLNEQYEGNRFIVKIDKIIFSEVPKIKNLEQLQVYFQIFVDKNCIFQSNLTNINNQDQCLYFEVGKTIDEDCFFRLKHQHNGEIKQAILRGMVHPYFFTNRIIRFTKQDLDIADMFQVSDDFFIDFFISFEEQLNYKLNNIFDLINYFQPYRGNSFKYQKLEQQIIQENSILNEQLNQNVIKDQSFQIIKEQIKQEQEQKSNDFKDNQALQNQDQQMTIVDNTQTTESQDELKNEEIVSINEDEMNDYIDF